MDIGTVNKEIAKVNGKLDTCEEALSNDKDDEYFQKDRSTYRYLQGFALEKRLEKLMNEKKELNQILNLLLQLHLYNAQQGSIINNSSDRSTSDINKPKLLNGTR